MTQVVSVMVYIWEGVRNDLVSIMAIKALYVGGKTEGNQCCYIPIDFG